MLCRGWRCEDGDGLAFAEANLIRERRAGSGSCEPAGHRRFVLSKSKSIDLVLIGNIAGG